MAGAKKKAAKKTSSAHAPDVLEDAQLHWEWIGRGGEPQAKAVANVLKGLQWIVVSRENPEAKTALRVLEDEALRYLGRVGEEIQLRIAPYSREKAPDFERIAELVERWASRHGGTGEEAIKAAATIFLIEAPKCGVALPSLMGSHEENLRVLVGAIRGSRRKYLGESSQKRAFGWTRIMLRVGGRTDADNALKRIEFAWTKKDRPPVK